MDGFAHFSRSNVLFGEDFDRAEAVPDPEVIEPAFSIGELTEAREAAWRDGHAAGLQESATETTASIRQAIDHMAAQLSEERDAAVARAEHHAESIARLLLGSLGAAFPELCAHHGDQEVCAIIRIVLPGLMQEPAITIRAHPRTAAGIAQEIARADPELAARVHNIECDAMTPGDVRVTWHNGAATRDAAALWSEVAEALLPIKETNDGG
jgi:flagellar biosynthesis/type III secretory pathway protein FliH